MGNILLLTKVFLKNSVFKTNNTSKTNNKAKKIIGYIVIFAYVIGVFGFLSYEIINMLNSVNQAALVLGVFLLSIGFLVLIQTVSSTMNLFYFSKDIENILPLPVKPHQILIAKFNVLLITEYFTIIMFALAPFIIYGVLTGAGALFYLYGALILLIFPILPAVVSALLVVVIMSFAKTIKNKEKLQVIGTILIVAFVLGFQFAFSGQQEMNTEQLVSALTQVNGTVDIINNYFITLEPATQALTDYNTIQGLFALLKIAGISLGAYIVFILITNKMYLRGVVGASVSGKKHKRVKKNMQYKKKKALSTYVNKELIMLMKNPIYFMQCVLPAVLIPIVFAVMFLIKPISGQDIPQFEINDSILLCILVGAICFMLTMVFIPVTSISRDGQNAVFIKYIPISLYKQFQYKSIPSILISIIPIVIVLLIAYLVFRINLLTIGLAFIIGFIINVLYSYLMIIVDLKRPKLNWDTEYAVVKQNFNMIYGFIFNIAYIILIGVVAIFLSHLNVFAVAGIIFIISLLPLIAVDRYVYNNQNKLFEKIF